MADLANRRRGTIWKGFVATALRARGLDVQPSPSPSRKLSERVADDDGPRADITGPDAIGWHLVTASDLQFDFARRLDSAEQMAVLKGVRHAAVIQYRRGAATSPYVIVSLDTFADILQAGEL